MRFSSVGVAVCLSFGIFAVACSSEDEAWPGFERAPASAGKAPGDGCVPGNEIDADEMPDARCALRTEYHVPDLGEPDDGAEDGGLGTSSLRPLDANGAAVPSCNGKSGPGHSTCGANGNDNCCRTKTVPPGQADAKTKVTAAFDLGVYEVTAGRFKAFVDAVGGDLRGAANQGKLSGFDTAHAMHLPASRAAVDDALGPACKARSDVSQYGALTWPDEDVEEAVAKHMSDDNARAADIRADATAPRLLAKPIGCVSYYMAEAFCAWDGGRLPSNVEWVYAALGGSQRRAFPWGEGRTADRLVTDLKRDANSFTYPADFPFYGNFMNAYHIAPPGNKPAGVARWGHHDMGGNMLEWVSDILGPNAGIVRGGSWEGHKDRNSEAYMNYPLDRSYGSLGFRCAYGPAQVAEPPAPAPGPEAKLVPVHRSYSGKKRDHLQGLTQGEGAPAYAYEGVSFQVWSDPVGGGRALYRCRTRSNQHFLSNDAKCEGHVSEGRLGYVRSKDTAATKPIYRCASKDGADHLSTLTPAECKKAAFVVEGTQGFARP